MAHELGFEQADSAIQLLAGANLRVGEEAQGVLTLGIPWAGHAAFCPSLFRLERKVRLKLADGEDVPHDLWFPDSESVVDEIGERSGILVCKVRIIVAEVVRFHIDPHSIVMHEANMAWIRSRQGRLISREILRSTAA